MEQRPRIVIAVFDRVQTLDVSGPAEVFGHAGRYEVEIAGPTREPVATNVGVGLAPARAFAEVAGPIDTLLVAGGLGVHEAVREGTLVEFVERVAPDARRVASVCTGAFALAAAGLLHGRRATTHWAWCDRLREEDPSVRVEDDPIYVFDGPVRTSAGVTAGMDLALALVEEDHGPQLALAIARQLVLYARRPGSQSQFSAPLSAQAADRAPLRELQAWMVGNLAENLSVEALADRVAMSRRHFARAFRAETGSTPAVYVERLRVDRARIELETTSAPIEAIAARCGFGSVETLRRAFSRRLGVNPSDYRKRFAA
jgi:transcriptional regulator GlxA family with amidase domain